MKIYRVLSEISNIAAYEQSKLGCFQYTSIKERETQMEETKIYSYVVEYPYQHCVETLSTYFNNHILSSNFARITLNDYRRIDMTNGRTRFGINQPQGHITAGKKEKSYSLSFL